MSGPSPGVDAQGRSPTDPTANVLDLVRAAIQRQDDLRDAADRHVREIAGLRADYDQKLREAETARINAIRAVDVGAVNRAAEVSAQQAMTLAAQVACVSADTPILCVDLVWRAAGDLVVGDQLVAVSEFSVPLVGDAIASQGRKYVRATVTANSLREDELLRVSTPLGMVRCNPQHPWLAKRPRSKYVQWVWMAASELEPGDLVSRPFEVWEVDRSYEAGWLAGMYDGEGSLSVSNKKTSNMRLCITQSDGPTGDLILAAMRMRCSKMTVTAKSVQEGRKPQSQYEVRNLADMMKMLGSVRPSRLLPRSAGVWEGKHLTAPRIATVVQAVEPAGRGAIASLTTDTHTYIAGGFVMHNTSAETLRTQVQAAATASAVALAAALDPLITAIADLRKAQYEAQGVKANVVETRLNMGAVIGAVVAAIAVIGLIFTLASR